jgi:uncharacterized protein involved in type VI secretion and phage assembly
MSLAEPAPAETSLEAGGYAKGVAMAIVTQNQDPDGMCRVKVRYPWYDKPRESHWARLATPMAGKDRGLVAIPEVGDEVIVAFERQDLCFPVVLGASHNGKDTGPFTNGDGKNDVKIFKSRQGHFLKFDDGSSGSVELSMKSGKRLLIDDHGVTIEDDKGNHFKIDSDSNGIEISAQGSLTIKAASVSIQATGSLELKANASVTVRGTVINLN